MRTKQYELIHYYEIGEWELFDLARDPEELRSVYGDRKYTPVVAQMKRKFNALRRQYAVPAMDPAPYYPWELPPEYRRPGTPGAEANAIFELERERYRSESENVKLPRSEQDRQCASDSGANRTGSVPATIIRHCDAKRSYKCDRAVK